MYRRIVVPLDGSELAERVLPHVAALATRFSAAVTLVRACEPRPTASTVAAAVPAGRAAHGGVARVEPAGDDASSYLAGVARRLAGGGMAVHAERVDGGAAASIVAVARRRRADLVAMTTHGRGGPGRPVLGSVAETVVRRAPCPVLLVRVARDPSPTGPPDEGSIRAAVLGRLVEDGQLRRLAERRLGIDLADGTVVLRGHVRTEKMARRVAELARGVPGVAAVVDRLVADDRLVRDAAAAIGRLGAADRPSRLRLSADHGHLRVAGDFPSDEARAEALRIVSGLPGVVAVTDDRAV
jgi:nucleotide-binding universal stress UspA family protein/osmotically-inducible protein OsmY